jgi:predicted DNA-binding transcriptional regulator AlpA
MPAKCGKRSIWKASEIDAWLEARFAARTAEGGAE